MMKAALAVLTFALLQASVSVRRSISMMESAKRARLKEGSLKSSSASRRSGAGSEKAAKGRAFAGGGKRESNCVSAPQKSHARTCAAIESRILVSPRQNNRSASVCGQVRSFLNPTLLEERMFAPGRLILGPCGEGDPRAEALNSGRFGARIRLSRGRAVFRNSSFVRSARAPKLKYQSSPSSKVSGHN